MKKIKTVIIIVFLTAIVSSLKAQVILPMYDVYGEGPCSLWCWNMAATNMLYYYYGSNPSKIEIAEVARVNGLLGEPCNCTSCFLMPDSCCRTAWSVTDLLKNWDFRFYGFGIPTSILLEQIFTANKPVIILVRNQEGGGEHVFTAHGIEGNLVHFIDGFLGRTRRPIDDIYPNKIWSGTSVPNFSPNCSPVNEVTHSIRDSRTYYAKNTMKISGYFQDNSTSVFKSDNGVLIEYQGPGTSSVCFKVMLGSSLAIYTGENNCP